MQTLLSIILELFIYWQILLSKSGLIGLIKKKKKKKTSTRICYYIVFLKIKKIETVIAPSDLSSWSFTPKNRWTGGSKVLLTLFFEYIQSHHICHNSIQRNSLYHNRLPLKKGKTTAQIRQRAGHSGCRDHRSGVVDPNRGYCISWTYDIVISQ